MKVRGIIEHIGETETFSEKFEVKRLLLNRVREKYDPHIMIDFVNKSIDMIDEVNLGDEVEVSINVSSRKGKEDRWWSSIRGWKIEGVTEDKIEPLEEEKDGIPF